MIYEAKTEELLGHELLDLIKGTLPLSLKRKRMEVCIFKTNNNNIENIYGYGLANCYV